METAPIDLKLQTLRSSGAFGKCYLSYYNCEYYVIKVISDNHYRPAEVDALISCAEDGHKSIAQHIATYRNGTDVWIMQEFVSGYELADYMNQLEHGFDELQCCDIITQLISAVQHIHAKCYIHGDLKPENLLFEDDSMQDVKLVDFGAARYVNQTNSYNSRNL